MRASVVSSTFPRTQSVSPRCVVIKRATQLSHCRGRSGVNDDQVIADRDRAFADRDAARAASETANREASITKRQRDEYMSLLATESARLAQVQQELHQAREMGDRSARAAVSSTTVMPARIEVSTSIGGGTPMSCRALQCPPESHHKT